MKSIIISAFPACGKTYLHTVAEKYDFTTSDSDSSKFSWVLDENGKSTGVRNPDFPNNYMAHIKSLLGKVNFIMVSSHDEVRVALEEHMLDYLLVNPSPSAKECFVGRMVRRGSPESFIKLLNDNWDNWTDVMSLRKKYNPISGIFLGDGEYLGDKIFILETFLKDYNQYELK